MTDAGLVTEEAERVLEQRYGTSLVDDLFALGNLIIRLESRGNPPPWVVSSSSHAELTRNTRQNRSDLPFHRLGQRPMSTASLEFRRDLQAQTVWDAKGDQPPGCA